MIVLETTALERSMQAWTDMAAEIERLWRSDPSVALERAGEWLAAERAAGSPEGQAWALRSHADALRMLGQYDAALAEYAEAEHLFQEFGLYAEAATTCIGCTNVLRRLGRYGDALKLALENRDYLLAHGYELQAAKQSNTLGTIYRPMGQLEAALRSYRQALALFRRLESWADVADVEQNIGNVFVELARYEQALRHLRRAERIRRRLGLQSDVAFCLTNIGLLSYRCGEFGQSLEALSEARAIYEVLDFRAGVTNVNHNLLFTYVALNLNAEAAAAAEKAISGYRDMGMPWELGQVLLADGRLAAAAGEPVRARERLEEARELFDKNGNALWEAVARLEQGWLAASGEDPSECEALLEPCHAATRWLEGADAPGRTAFGVLVEGALLARLERSTEALDRFNQVVALGRDGRVDHLLYEAHAAIGDLLEASNAVGASASYRRAIESLELVRARARADDLKLAFVEDKADLYARLVGLLVRDGTPEGVAEAYGIVQRSKARTLLEDIQAGAHGSRRGQAAQARRLARRVRDLQARLNAVYAQAYGTEETPTADSVVRSGQAVAVAQLEAEHARATRELQLVSRAQEPLAAAELPEADVAAWTVPDGTILVEYYAVRSDLLAFVKVGSALSLQRVAAVEDVARLAERLRMQLRHAATASDHLIPNIERFRRMIDGSLRALWEAVIAPLAEQLDGCERLVVVPHGPLHGLPFHAFYDGNRYLAERHTISYSPSAAVYTTGLWKNQSPAERALVVGVDDPALPWVASEVAAVADAWPSATVLTGRRATARALRRQAGHFDVLHLATHAVFRADNPMFSSIKLADAWLTMADLRELTRGAQLVTLSACETGVGGLAGADEVLGLTRGILGAGCSTVVASLWPVTDETTARLMAGFYGQLQEGSPPSEALRASMLALRADYDHPYFWAAFAVTGGAD